LVLSIGSYNHTKLSPLLLAANGVLLLIIGALFELDEVGYSNGLDISWNVTAYELAGHSHTYIFSAALCVIEKVGILSLQIFLFTAFANS
jgi:hypothetical protein